MFAKSQGSNDKWGGSFNSLNDFRGNVAKSVPFKNERQAMIHLYDGSKMQNWFLNEIFQSIEEIVQYPAGVYFLKQINDHHLGDKSIWLEAILKNYESILNYRPGLVLLSNILKDNKNSASTFIHRVFSDYDNLKDKENYFELINQIYKIFQDYDWFQQIWTDNSQWTSDPQYQKYFTNLHPQEDEMTNNSQQNSQSRKNSQSKNSKSKVDLKKRSNSLHIVAYDPNQTKISFPVASSPKSYQISSSASQIATPNSSQNKEIRVKSQPPNPKSQKKNRVQRDNSNHSIDQYITKIPSTQLNSQQSPTRSPTNLKKKTTITPTQLNIVGDESDSDSESSRSSFHKVQSTPNLNYKSENRTNQKSLKKLSNRSSLREAIKEDQRLLSDSSNDGQLELFLSKKHEESDSTQPNSQKTKTKSRQKKFSPSQTFDSDSNDDEIEKKEYNDEILPSQLVDQLTCFSQSYKYEPNEADIFYVDDNSGSSLNNQNEHSSSDDENKSKVDPLLALLESHIS